jgi:hypothetical protein
MKPMAYIEILLLILGLLSDAYGQGITSGPGGAPPSSPTGLPHQSGMPDQQTPGTTGANATGTSDTSRYSTGASNAGAQTARPRGTVQPIYQNSAAVDTRGGMSTQGMEQGQSNTSSDQASNEMQADGSSEQRGELGVWLVKSGGPGVEIRRVTPDSAADRAGLRTGDFILQVNGRGAAEAESTASMIRAIPAGQLATLTIWRDNNPQQMHITMEPAGERHEAGYRGTDKDSHESNADGDINGRISRLEQRISDMTNELQQLRQQSTSAGATQNSPPSATNQPSNATNQQPPAETKSGTQSDSLFE